MGPPKATRECFVWAFAGGEIYRVKCGRVVTPDSWDGTEYVGAADHTNNTGELTAILMALRLAVAAGWSGEVEIRYDSTYAADAVRALAPLASTSCFSTWYARWPRMHAKGV